MCHWYMMKGIFYYYTFYCTVIYNINLNTKHSILTEKMIISPVAKHALRI